MSGWEGESLFDTPGSQAIRANFPAFAAVIEVPSPTGLEERVFTAKFLVDCHTVHGVTGADVDALSAPRRAGKILNDRVGRKFTVGKCGSDVSHVPKVPVDEYRAFAHYAQASQYRCMLQREDAMPVHVLRIPMHVRDVRRNNDRFSAIFLHVTAHFHRDSVHFLVHLVGGVGIGNRVFCKDGIYRHLFDEHDDALAEAEDISRVKTFRGLKETVGTRDAALVCSKLKGSFLDVFRCDHSGFSSPSLFVFIHNLIKSGHRSVRFAFPG